MATPTTASRPASSPRSPAAHDPHAPAYQAYLLLRTVFTIAPIAFGIDKFFNVLTDWPHYLAPFIDNVAPGSPQNAMMLVGVIEIIAGLAVALRPRVGAPVVALWLTGIIVNLLIIPGFYDVALRDFGLLVGAVALARLATVYGRPHGSINTQDRSRQPSSAPLPETSSNREAS